MKYSIRKFYNSKFGSLKAKIMTDKSFANSISAEAYVDNIKVFIVNHISSDRKAFKNYLSTYMRKYKDFEDNSIFRIYKMFFEAFEKEYEECVTYENVYSIYQPYYTTTSTSTSSSFYTSTGYTSNWGF